jgi:hypothetical protein
MAPPVDIVTEPTTLRPLTDYPILHRGLYAVTFFGFLSFTTSLALFLHLGWRLLTWTRKTSESVRINQFIILLFNLVLADIQQSVAFLLNVRWVGENAIIVGTSTCWAQGWFVSTGDLGSGIFTLAIAVHAFMDIVFNYRLGQRMFAVAVVALWAFNYICAIIGMGMHPTDFYARAGAWCWINTEYTNERLWLHYFWVIIAEFGTVLIYALVFLIIQRRVKEAFYTNSKTAIRARSAAKMIVAYPIVYVVCTLPLVKARLTSMAYQPVSFLELTIAGSMITSNGWLDVLLYTLTRRGVLFGSDPLDDQAGVIDTFHLRPDQSYGTTTHIEANKISRSNSKRKSSRQGFHSSTGSTEELFAPVPTQGVKTETTVVVQSDAMEMGRMPQRHKSQDALSDSRSQVSRK